MGNIAHVEHWQVGLLENGKCKRPLEGILCVCVGLSVHVCELEPDDGWSVLTCAAQWTVRLDVAGLPPSLSLSPTLLHSFFASLPQGQTCHVAGAHSSPSPRSFSSRSTLSCSLTFSGVVGQMEAQSLGTYFH